MPELNLYDRDWPIWTYQEQLPPAKFVPDESGRHGGRPTCMVSGGCIVSGSDIRDSVLFSSVRVHSCCTISEAVILPDCEIGRGCRLTQGGDRPRLPHPRGHGDRRGRRTLDAERFYRTDSGVVLVTQEMLEKLGARG